MKFNLILNLEIILEYLKKHINFSYIELKNATSIVFLKKVFKVNQSTISFKLKLRRSVLYNFGLYRI